MSLHSFLLTERGDARGSGSPEKGETWVLLVQEGGGVCKRVSPRSKATHGGGWRRFGAGGGAGPSSAASGPGRRPRRRALPRPPRQTPQLEVRVPELWGPDTRLFCRGRESVF